MSNLSRRDKEISDPDRKKVRKVTKESKAPTEINDMEERNIATSKDLLHDAGISRSLGLWASTARFQLLAIRSNRSIILGLGFLGSLHPSCVNCRNTLQI